MLPVKEFPVGIMVLVAHGWSLVRKVKWPAFKSPYYGPFRVVTVNYTRYAMNSGSGRHTRVDLHDLSIME